jgi:hypothetical protein
MERIARALAELKKGAPANVCRAEASSESREPRLPVARDK